MHLSGDFEGPQPQLTKAIYHGAGLVSTAAATIIPPPSHPITLHHNSIPPHRPRRLLAAAAAQCHRYESRITPLPAGKMRSANSFRHLFRHGPHLHRRRRHRLRPPGSALQPRLWLQGLADAPNYVAAWNNKFGLWTYSALGPI